jgi:hypothetical protein
MTWDIPEQDLDHSSECLPERWGTPRSTSSIFWAAVSAAVLVQPGTDRRARHMAGVTDRVSRTSRDRKPSGDSQYWRT